MTKIVLIFLTILIFSTLQCADSYAGISANSPPVYCIKKKVNPADPCLVFLFGSIHYANDNEVAVTAELLSLAQASKHIYFELAPYGMEVVNAKSFVSESLYVNDRKAFFSQSYYPHEILPLKLKEAAQLYSKTGSLTAIHGLIDQAIQDICGLSRYNGTEEYLARKLAGSDIYLHSLEFTSRANYSTSSHSVKTTMTATINLLQKKSHTSSSELNSPPIEVPPTTAELAQFCAELKPVAQEWRLQERCRSTNCVGKDSLLTQHPNQLRNQHIFQKILLSLDKTPGALIVIGYKHLYGAGGMIKRLEDANFQINTYKK